MIGSRAPDHETAILELVADLRPVHRVRPPIVNATLWIGAVALLALVPAYRTDPTALWARLSATPDMWLALVGSFATMILATIATFELGLPDRSPAWSLAPLPDLAVWLGASGLGCLRATGIDPFGPIPTHEIIDCFGFIVGFSVPLSVALVLLQRRTFPLQPSLNAGLGGLAAAAAAATLLTLVHPFDATALDLGVHFVAVSIVVGANGWLTARFVA